MQPIPAMDGHLFFAVLRSLGRYPETLYDLKKIKVLNEFYSSSVPRDRTAEDPAAKGDFSAIGEMENLHTLHFSNGANYPLLPVNDFSFLPKCRKLKGLDLSGTSFTDCSLLLQLPALQYVRLPEKEKLTNPELLKNLPETVKVSFLHQASAASSAPAYTPPPRKKPEGSEQVKAIVEEIKKRTATDCYTLKVRPGAAPGLTDSKFGGFPYWDPALPYPVDDAGEKLVLLTQINFDQFPVDGPLPQGGMLQFFVGQDDCSGLDRADGFRVVYHEKIDPSVTADRLRPLHIPTAKDPEFFPVDGELAVELEKAVGYMGPADGRFDDLFSQVYQAVTGQALEDGKYHWNTLESEDRDYLWDQLSTAGHHLLGYPYFTQEDPRNGAYETLLFQMDSDDSILWGDCGVANFFIDLEKLKRRDFSDVFYTWDCC